MLYQPEHHTMPHLLYYNAVVHDRPPQPRDGTAEQTSYPESSVLITASHRVYAKTEVTHYPSHKGTHRKMTSTATLTSFAILKTHLDYGRDYFDYIRPFVLQILADTRPPSFTSDLVKRHLQDRYGLRIPERTIEIVLKRIVRQRYLKKAHHSYRITGDLPNSKMALVQQETENQINAVLRGLQEYHATLNTVAPLQDTATSICRFLSRFDISCLKAYLQGTTIPPMGQGDDTDITLVGKYVLHLQEKSPVLFEYFMVMVQGHMLANALLCPDLERAPQYYKETVFYLDTPIVIKLLGLDSEQSRAATQTLVEHLINLRSRIRIFSHTRDELDHVLKYAYNNWHNPDARTPIIVETRKRQFSRSDLWLAYTELDKNLHLHEIRVQRSPEYNDDSQLDELHFEDFLDDEVSYYNPNARDYDIKSVRSIFALRGNIMPTSLEKSRAVLVSSNRAFARAAFKYGEKNRASYQISSVIDDLTLTNLSWLKAPVGAPDLPKAKVLAYSYAALQPSRQFLEISLSRMDDLKANRQVTAEDHQLLRMSSMTHDRLMTFTMGDASKVTPDTVLDTLSTIKRDIRSKENRKLEEERLRRSDIQDELRTTSASLERQTGAYDKLRSKIYWQIESKSAQKAKIAKRAFITVTVLLGGAPAILTLGSILPPAIGIPLALGSPITFITVARFLLGSPDLQSIEQRLHRHYMGKAIMEQESKLGIKISV